MTWTEDYKAVRQTAERLSDVADFEALVKLADTVGKGLHSEGVSSRQIRVLLSETIAGDSRIRRGKTLGITLTEPSPDQSAEERREARRVQENAAARREAALLNISLVYHGARNKKGNRGIEVLADLMRVMTADVHTFEDFKVLRKFSEAVVAYFKFYGGK